ncbi:hypothetical protein CLV89_103190 [Tritonibacter scottomollicae]|uniref:Uncharacterized protein n=1 Tax=Tritonibacter scottomollicae TaxID=483013 RepID=A0A2T1AJU3_TRISK|nr:hypothetical protein CLV89_103190 [Tritonibacter scottomollicae]
MVFLRSSRKMPHCGKFERRARAQRRPSSSFQKYLGEREGQRPSHRQDQPWWINVENSFGSRLWLAKVLPCVSTDTASWLCKLS